MIHKFMSITFLSNLFNPNNEELVSELFLHPNQPNLFDNNLDPNFNFKILKLSSYRIIFYRDVDKPFLE